MKTRDRHCPSCYCFFPPPHSELLCELLFACKEAADVIYGWDEPDNPILPILKKVIAKAERA